MDYAIFFIICSVSFSGVKAKDKKDKEFNKNQVIKDLQLPSDRPKLTEEDVMTGLQAVLRGFMPAENENFEDEENPEPSEGVSDAVADNPQSKGKGNKYTNVNFVLYNRGIKFQKQDDTKKFLRNQQVKFHCVLIVSNWNKCYGWDMDEKKMENGTMDADTMDAELELFEAPVEIKPPETEFRKHFEKSGKYSESPTYIIYL